MTFKSPSFDPLESTPEFQTRLQEIKKIAGLLSARTKSSALVPFLLARSETPNLTIGLQAEDADKVTEFTKLLDRLKADRRSGELRSATPEQAAQGARMAGGKK